MSDCNCKRGLRGYQGIQGVQGADGEQGVQGADGEQGVNGADGLSAYEVAVAEGFVGDESSWLTSLVGADGAAPEFTAWQPIPLSAGWTAGVIPPQYCKFGDAVFLKGSAFKTFAGAESNAEIVTLPVGHRPNSSRFIPVFVNLGAPATVPTPFVGNFWMTVRIGADGIIVWVGVPSGGVNDHYIYFDGIVFRAEA